MLFPLRVHAQPNYNFSAESGTYTALTNGTSVLLSNFNDTGSVTDDGYMNDVPIGFAFKYDGKDYSAIHITTNGLVAFGNPFVVDARFNTAVNSLAIGHPPNAGTAYLAPLWDDLDIASTANLRYELSGNAPSRVFTVEWNNVKWYNVPTRRVSFQVQLFETSNEIRFVYKRETGRDGFTSSIGITDTLTGPDHFIALLDASSNPPINTVYEETIFPLPVTGQVYKFSAMPCSMPKLKLEGFTNHNISFSNSLVGNNGFEYAVTTNNTPPVAGTIASQSTITISSLSSATAFYFHCRNICNSSTKSAWKTVAFVTSNDVVPLPYTQDFSTPLNYSMPSDLRMIRRDSTSWYGVNNARYFGNYLYSSYGWFYLPPINLNSSYRYNVKFAYGRGPAYQTLFVKYASQMDSSVTTGTPIVTITEFQEGLTDTSIIIQPAQTGNYYIGFRGSSRDTSLYVDDITVSVFDRVLPVKFISLKGLRINRENILKWNTADEINSAGFYIERSLDGADFDDIGYVSARNEPGGSEYRFADKVLSSNKYYYRIYEKDKDGKKLYSSTIVIRAGGFENMALYPNPATDNINVLLEGLKPGDYKYVITDVTGRAWLQSKIVSTTSSCLFNINTKILPKGVYFLKLSAGILNERLVQKFLKR
ncbi:MAG: hypothetical protein JWQ40_661 [Segetibacter sp.]|nr:hypothetical protein [Segetibacter sp.]